MPPKLTVCGIKPGKFRVPTPGQDPVQGRKHCREAAESTSLTVVIPFSEEEKLLHTAYVP